MLLANKRNKESNMARQIRRLVKLEFRSKPPRRLFRIMMLKTFPTRPKTLTRGMATESNTKEIDIIHQVAEVKMVLILLLYYLVCH